MYIHSRLHLQWIYIYNGYTFTMDIHLQCARGWLPTRMACNYSSMYKDNYWIIPNITLNYVNVITCHPCRQPSTNIM